MSVLDPADPLLPPSPPSGHGRHRSARERQRKGPMWGCLGALFKLIVIAAILLFIVIGGGWWYLGTNSFEGLVKLRIEETLEARLGRDVTIGSVQFIRSHPQRIIINDLRIANAPGGVSRSFAIVRQVEITGGVESFWARNVKIGRVDIRDPRIWFEVFPEGSPLVHNFPPWKTGPKAKHEIVHVDLNRMYVTNGGFLFLDRRHDIQATVTHIGSEMTVTRAKDLYEGVMTSPFVRVRIQDYEPMDVDLRGGFRYTPGTLALKSIGLKGRGIEAFVSGKIEPLTEGVYDLRLRSRFELPRIKEVFRVEKKLEGLVALDTTLKGKQGNFVLAGGWASDRIAADVYTLTSARGRLNVTGEATTVDVERARYGGGTIGAHYLLTQYAEPYPMKIDLRYDGVSIEKLFSDWGVKDTGLRGAATGTLAYHWNKDQVLAGAGTGSAKLTKNAVAFSNARFSVPIAGSTDFALDNGVVKFRSGELDTDASHVSFTGSLRIEDLFSDLKIAIRSNDFSELDRIGFNFARSADKNDYELLGLGGSGTIDGTVKGTIKEPQVVAAVRGSNVRYNEVQLGDADIALRYDGKKSALTFDRAVFTNQGGRLALTGTVTFPDRGPSPQFDIAVEANGYPAQRAIDAVDLKFKIGAGIATGKMLVAGTPDSGRVTFLGLIVRRADAELKLNGDVQWAPGEGNVRFDLDIAANNFPIEDVISFLDLGTYPVTGKLTGLLNIKGPKAALEGRGQVTVTEGSVFGEPVDLASADIAFEQGKMRATNVIVRAPAGEIRGEAELDLATEKFSYTIASQSIDLSKLKLLAGLKDLLGGNITLHSSGAGTFDQPELVLEATLNEATLRGLTLPPGSAPPTLYLAIRGGQLIVRGAIADILTIDGEGTIGQNSAVDALVRVNVADIAKLAQISPKTATIPASGNLLMVMKIGGRFSPLDALTIDAQVPVFNLQIADHAFTAPSPLHVTLKNGRIGFDSVTLQSSDAGVTVTGYADITGDKTINVNIRGRVEAALLQLVMTGVRATGALDVAASVTGTITAPRFQGTAELNKAQIKFAGFPQLIDDINGVLRFKGDRIEIESVRATVGGGTVVLGGFIGVEGLKPTTFRVTVQGNDVAIRYYEGLTVEGNFSLLLTGDLNRAMLQGDVNVTRALWYREFELQQALLNVILARKGVTPIASASWQDRIGLRIHLSAPETLAVKNNLADVTGSAELDVNGTVANPIVLGEVTLDEGGKVTFQNNEYNVVRGTIAFQNPFRIDPYFDVTLEGTVSGNISEIESGPIDVTINLTGTLDRLSPTITSDPPASDITLFSLLGFGGMGGNRTPGAAEGPGAALYGQSLLYQSLFSAIGQRVFPFVDSFTYDPGLLDTGGGAKQRVTFEKRISNRIRFLMVYNLDDQQSKQVVEWLVNRDWTLQLTRDETNEYRLDARFRRRYPALWTWGSRGRGEMATFGSLGVKGEVLQQPITPAPPTTTVQPNAFDDAPIVAVNFHADANVDTTTMGDYVTLRPGQRVTIRELQASIKNLYSTGNFRDVRVDAVQTGENRGVTLTFSLFLHYRVGKITWDGLQRRDRTRAERGLQVRTGEVHSFNAVDDSANEIQQTLNRGGYLEATVDPETTFDRAHSLANVTFHVTTGPKAKVAAVNFEGNPAPFTREELIKRMKRRPGRSFDLGEAREDANRMKNLMVRRDYRKADVDFLGHNYDAQRDEVTLRYSVNAGPKVRVAVEGVSRSAVRRLIPFARNQEYSEDVIDRAADRIVEAYQSRGNYYATVDTESSLDRATNTWTTTFHVNPGAQYRLADVTFSGNIKVSDKKLQDVVATSARGGFKRLFATLFRRPSGVTAGQLSDDRDAVESFYRLQGFSEATVATPVVTTRNDGTMHVDFPVTEGPQTVLAAVKVEGNKDVSANDLPNLLLKAGEPLNPQLLHDDTVALQTFYADRGNVEVQVKPRVDVSEDKTTATVTQTIAEGPQVKVGDVIVRGNTYTNSEVILRKSDLDKGAPFSYRSILEAQRQLYRLGIFQRVEVQPEQAGTTVGDRNVVITVEEGKNLTLTGTVGLRAERARGTKDVIDPNANEDNSKAIEPRVAIAAAHRNLFGTGRYGGIEAIFSSKEREFFLTYREPFVSRWDVPLQVQVYQTDDSTRPGTTIQQRGTSIEATKYALSQTRWSVRYDYRISKCVRGLVCAAVNEGDPVAGLDRSLLNIDINSISPTFFWDHRDDILDPHRGFFTSASIEYAFPFISAKANFLKEFAQGTYYLPASARTVFAFSGRAGLIQPLGDTTVDDVPLVERFTAGGETSHRAFPLDLFGTLCQDDKDFDKNGDCDQTLYQRFDFTQGKFAGPILPIGGSSLMLLNAEYRFPVFGPVGAAVFVDAGTISRKSAIQFDNLRYGVGVGVRYLSPVGPLRVDVGIPLDRRNYERSWQYFITLGYAF